MASPLDAAFVIPNPGVAITLTQRDRVIIEGPCRTHGLWCEPRILFSSEEGDDPVWSTQIKSYSFRLSGVVPGPMVCVSVYENGCDSCGETSSKAEFV